MTVACKNCGSVGSWSEFKATHPNSLSCCPERSEVPVEDLIKTLWAKAYPDPRLPMRAEHR